jgi:uncharacterized membrane protein YhaH (DUF805 family)
MDFRFVFLDPQGRLAPVPFARGFILLTGAMMLVTIASAIVSQGLGILQYTLVFPYLCVFGKRLHDAGLSAWLWLAFLAGFGFVNMLASAVLLPILSPGAYAIQMELQALMESGGWADAFEELARLAPEYARLSAVTSVAGFLIASALTGFAAYRMRSDPQPNRYGPPGAAPTFS